MESTEAVECDNYPMNKIGEWNVVGPLPDQPDFESYIVWRECDDGLIEEGVYQFSTEWDGLPADMIPHGFPKPPDRISLRVYSRSCETISASRLHKMKMPPYPYRNRTTVESCHES